MKRTLEESQRNKLIVIRNKQSEIKRLQKQIENLKEQLKTDAEILAEKRLLESKQRENPVGATHSAWSVVIERLDFLSQWKIRQTNRRLADIVNLNAESKLRKYRRQIQENKYM